MATRSPAATRSLERAQADRKPAGARRRVGNIGDRTFYLIAKSLAILVLILALLLVADLIRGAWESIGQFGAGFLIGTTWDPVTRVFGTLPTIIGTLVKGFIALLIAIPISI